MKGEPPFLRHARGAHERGPARSSVGKGRVSLRVGASLVAIVGVAASALILKAEWQLARNYDDVRLPPIAADRTPDGVARGELLFHSRCMQCHGGPDGRATGRHLDEIPSVLGEFWSANLAHRDYGVHTRSDAQLARVLRNGVLPDGRLSIVMNGFSKLGDADIAALIGYMRSGAPVFEPGGSRKPLTQVSLIGSLLASYVARLKTDAPASGVRVPTKAPTTEYGHYMVAAMGCGGCHTAGFADDKTETAGACAGGFELTDPTGARIYTSNITFDEATGIGRFSLDAFERAVTRGVGPDGYLVRKPMPSFARLDRTDIEAIYKYLQSLPAVERANAPGGHPPTRAKPTDCEALGGETARPLDLVCSPRAPAGRPRPTDGT